MIGADSTRDEALRSRQAGVRIIDVWYQDLERDVETRVTSEPDTVSTPLWLPDGKSIAYSVVRGGPPQLFRRNLATGKAEELLPAGGYQKAEAVSPDGQTLVYSERIGRASHDLWTLSLAGQGKPVPLLQSPFDKAQVGFSSDGRFVAFISNESGTPEVYVTPFPGPGEKTRVSKGGAELLRWSHDGRELLYLSSDGDLMSVPIRTSPALQIGTPTMLFKLKERAWDFFDVTPDGKRFLTIVPEVVANKLPLTVVGNWMSEVEK